jgi:hypothetical protein
MVDGSRDFFVDLRKRLSGENLSILSHLRIDQPNLAYGRSEPDHEEDRQENLTADPPAGPVLHEYHAGMLLRKTLFASKLCRDAILKCRVRVICAIVMSVVPKPQHDLREVNQNSFP